MWNSHFLLTLFVAASASAATVVVDNTATASIVAGDRANIRGFAFKPSAGSSGPASTLTQTVELASLTLFRPAFGDATTPSIGAGAGQLSSTTAPVYLKVYSSFTGGVTSSDVGTLLGVSSNAYSWSDVDALNGAGPNTNTAPPFDAYAFTFTALTLDKDTTYWMVFSETSDDLTVDVTNFRLIVEPAAVGSGSLYLADANQVRITDGTARDWGVYMTATVNTVPEPTFIGLSLLGGGLFLRRRRS